MCVCVCEELKSSLYLKNIRLTAYFSLGEYIGSRDGRGTRLKKQLHEKLVQIVLISAYLRRTNFTRQYHY